MTATVLSSYDPLRDKSYQATGLGADIVAFQAWNRSRGLSERTLDQYERDLARGALMYPDRTRDILSRQDALHIASAFQPKERRVRVAAWRSFYRAREGKPVPREIHELIAYYESRLAIIEGRR